MTSNREIITSDGNRFFVINSPIRVLGIDISDPVMVRKIALGDTNLLADYIMLIECKDEIFDNHDADENRLYLESKYTQINNKKERDTAGFIYVIEDRVGLGLFKIGMTTQLPDDRVNQFSPKLPFETAIIITIKTDDAYSLEAKLHDQFADKRRHGEWFILSRADVKEIREYIDDQD